MPSPYSPYPDQSFFPASYVKFLEQGGARVAPIPYDLPSDELATLLKSLNGALFTGGASSFFESAAPHAPTAYARTAAAIYAESEAAAADGEVWPLWGTCLGHELIGVIAAGLDYDTSPLSSGFDSENYSAPVSWTAAATSSRLWGPTPEVRSLLELDIAYNAHTMGFTPADFESNPSLSAAFNILGTSVDRSGKVFIASMEAKVLPIYTVQWHPEKANYEWNGGAAYNNINHSSVTVAAAYYPAAFFINEARRNERTFSSDAAEQDALIYNFASVFAPKVGLSKVFEQLYFFPPSHAARNTTTLRGSSSRGSLGIAE